MIEKKGTGGDLSSISLASRLQKQLTLKCIIKIKTTDVIYGAAAVPDTLTTFIVSRLIILTIEGKYY